MAATSGRPPRRRVRGLDHLLRIGSAELRLRLAVVGERLVDAMRRDLDDGLALPGLVVVFALGIALYFELPREPWLPAVAAAAAVAGGVTWLRRRSGHAARSAAVVAALLLGVLAAAYETVRVAAPRLDRERTVTVEGRISDLDTTATGSLRLVVDVLRMEGRGLTPEFTPTRISATLTARGHPLDVGEGVRFKARLKPPEGPVMPGGYDFARRAWFEGRGAGGYVLGHVTPIDLGPPPWHRRVVQAIGGLRHAIAERVRNELPGATGAIAAALMVGEQRAIPESAAEPLRASGLTHIVSISGLHMSLVAGGVIVSVRALLALFPALALGFPIKKWAAAAAFFVATIYLLLSGNQVAALRSHLMLSVALLAVMVDRPAITMHTIAVSAVLILAVEPSAVMEPSFRMSYLAVIALVASYDLYRRWVARHPTPRREAGLVAALTGTAARHAEGFAVSSLVAGLATAPVIAGTFFRAAPYSILANMAVLPVTGLLIMPAAIVAALAMPFGLDRLPLQAMGLGVDWMIAVGRWTAALPGGAGLIRAPHAAAMPLGIVAVLWLSAWKSRIRLFGLAPAIASLVLLFAGPRPDVLIGRHGTSVAVRDHEGRLRVLADRRDRFDTAIWLAADRDTRDPNDADLGAGWRCDPIGCVHRIAVPPASSTPAGSRRTPPDPKDDHFTTSRQTRAPAETPVDDRSIGVPADDSPRQNGPAGDGEAEPSIHGAERDRATILEIAVVRHPLGFEEDCRRAALVVTTLVAPPGCRDVTMVVDRLDLARGGAMALDFVGPPRRIGRPISAGSAAPERSKETPLRPTDVDPTRDVELDPDPEDVAVPERRLRGRPDRPMRTVADGPAAATVDAVTGDPGSPVRTTGVAVRDRNRDVATDPSPTLDETASEWIDDEVWYRRDVRIRTALPSPPRPWTPIDPRLAEAIRDSAAIAGLARSPEAATPSTPDAAAPVPGVIEPDDEVDLSTERRLRNVPANGTR